MPINLHGFAVGNPTMGHGANAYLPYMASHALISQKDMAAAEALCGGVYEPPPTKACADMVAQLLLQTYDINPYNIDELCEGEGWGSTPGCFTMGALNDAYKPTGRMAPAASRSPADARVGRPLSQTFVPCIDLYPIRTFMNSPAVQSALHIAVGSVVLPWDACSQVLKYTDIVHDMVPIYEDIFANSTMRVLVYSGDADSCVPYPGTEATVASFPFAQATPLRDPWQSWHYVSQAAPAVKQVGGKFMQWGERLAYATVRGAGHM
jgi:serine carboxypeptidase-like clade 1